MPEKKSILELVADYCKSIDGGASGDAPAADDKQETDDNAPVDAGEMGETE